MKKTPAKKKKPTVYTSPMLYFYGDPYESLDSWKHGVIYKGLFHIELFGIKIEVWKKL